MIDNEFKHVGLYYHNAKIYRKIKESYLSGEKVVGIVQATGTGKSFNALQLAFDNKEKQITYIVPSNGIIEHIKKIIEDNPNLDYNRDFPNLKFRTYQSFVNMSYEEIKNLDIDLLILDEFHHLGAPVWSARINTIIKTHPDMRIFGMTAYTVRDRGTAYERDMANPETDELFSNKIVSTYDLCDAMIDGVLPNPIYKSAYTNLIKLKEDLEVRVKNLHKESEDYKNLTRILEDVKKRVATAPSMEDVIKRNLKPNGKYIFFCPPRSEEGTNDMKTIQKEVLEWCKKIVPEEDVEFYSTTSEMGEEGKKNREAFYLDKTLSGQSAKGKLRIMFAINQYNEGIHAPNIDGVILGRGTTSDIVFFEQIGRALSIRGNTKEKFEEYLHYSHEELVALCRKRNILITEDMSIEQLINKLIAPLILDLANNFDYIKELENNFKNRIKERQEKGKISGNRERKLSTVSFDIEIENKNLYDMLQYVKDRLFKSWNDYYELAKLFYGKHKHLNITKDFKTINGYEYNESGIKLGNWISRQRLNFDNLSEEQKEKLKRIGFVQNVRMDTWEKNYNLARIYYEKHGHLNIPIRFKTINGYEYNESGINLGYWIENTRRTHDSLSEEQKEKLEKIGFVRNIHIDTWEKNYNLARIYYEKNGNLNIPRDFRTINGYEYNEFGTNLGYWIGNIRIKYDSLSKEQKEKLERIGFVQKLRMDTWEKNYKLAKIYYEKHGHLNIPRDFKTINGYEYNELGIKLGSWVSKLRARYNNLPEERKEMLKKIGFVQNLRMDTWEKNYKLAKIYYEKHGHLNIPRDFKTINGYEYNEAGTKLGIWVRMLRSRYDDLQEERKEKLEKIGFVQDVYIDNWQRFYNLAHAYYEEHGNLNIPQRYKIKNTHDEENGLGPWISKQRKNYKIGNLSEEQIAKLEQIGMLWNVKTNRKEIEKLCVVYSIDINKNKKVLKNISLREFKFKINYLQSLNISLVDNLGNLHEIFYMSSSNIFAKYGITTEEIINEFGQNLEMELK